MTGPEDGVAHDLSEERRIDAVPRWAAALLAALAVGFWVLALRLGLAKYFTIDELDFAHAGWLISEGRVLYREIFEIKFPLFFELLSFPFFAFGDDSGVLVWLRAQMAIIWTSTAALGAWLAWRRVGVWGLSVVPLWLSLPMTLARLTEIRPDVLALALYVLALALASSGLEPRRRGLAAGFVLMAAIWASYKVVFYGWIFGPAFLRDLLARRTGGRLWLGSPLAFLGGALAFWLVAFSDLASSGSLAAWWELSVGWSARHQAEYPGFPWTRYTLAFLARGAVVVLLALLGLWAGWRRAWSSAAPAAAEATRDHALLTGSLLGSGLVLVVQTVTFPYNHVPMAFFLAVYGAFGLSWALQSSRTPRHRQFRGWRRGVGAVLVVLVSAHFAFGALQAWWMGSDTHAYQLRVLDELLELTGPQDALYDNSGSFVVRPHAYFFYKTDAMIRRSMGERLVDEVPRAIVTSEAKGMLMDLRFPDLPAELRRVLLRNFQPYDDEIFLWGRRYDSRKAGEETFYAIETGRYFVPRLPAGAILRVGGRPVGEEPFVLEQGVHEVSYEGTDAVFHVLWLPRNGETYTPKAGPIEPRFSRLL